LSEVPDLDVIRDSEAFVWEKTGLFRSGGASDSVPDGPGYVVMKKILFFTCLKIRGAAAGKQSVLN
jgi:hypothetical protein